MVGRSSSSTNLPALSNLVQVLQWRAELHPQKNAFTLLSDREDDEVKLSYGELDRRARAIASVLQETCARGDRALLLYPTSVEYLAAFFGCLYAGTVAVPAYPPRFNRNLQRLQAMIADARPAVMLTTSQTVARLQQALKDTAGLNSTRWVCTDSIAARQEDEWRQPDIDEDTLAFLQYTSGSTGTPRGVMLSHRNLIHNSELLARAFEYTAESKCVSWLPIYHDMGLIGGVLQPLCGGFHCTLMSPAAFLQRPLRWLQVISRERATISGGPNFAYELCAQKIGADQRAELDLSSWNVAFNGSEPIRPETIDKFSAAFAACGFRREAFLSCYGLAEATLIVSAGAKSSPPAIHSVDSKLLENNRVLDSAPADDSAQLIVSCGRPLERIVIARPDTSTICAADEVGEIWVAGASVAQGYWNRPEETVQTFQAKLAGSSAGPFLRTGDLGFMRGNELFISGRLKDLIIIRGRNYYPQDLELTVERSQPSLRPGCGAAFSVMVDGHERLVIVQELARQPQSDINELMRAIREAVAEEHEIKVHALVLVKAGTISKTSSGKIQRHACRDGFLAGTLAVVAAWSADSIASEEWSSTSSTPLQSIDIVESWLRARLAASLRLDEAGIDLDEPITRYGLDSLDAMELMHGLESELGAALPLADLLEGRSIRQLAREAGARFFDVAAAPFIRAVSAGERDAKYPLSVGQSGLWFLQSTAPESVAYNITSAIRIRGELDPVALRRVFQKLLDRHPQLRARFSYADGELLQHVREHEEISFETEPAFDWSEAQLQDQLSAEAHRPFDLERGPLFRIKLFMRSQHDCVLLLCVHHIIADLWSLGVLMREMKLLYEAEKSQTRAALPSLELQYSDYVHWQKNLLAGTKGSKLWSYWQTQLAGELPALTLPEDRPRPTLQTFRGSTRFFKLSAELTQDLRSLSRRCGATLYMTLLAAFKVLLHRYTNQEDILVGSPSANRPGSDLGGVIGYFTNPLALRTRVEDNQSFEQFLIRIRQTVLDALAHQEMPFALLIEKLQPHRDPGRSPIFQTMFALQKTADDDYSAFALGETLARTSMGDLELQAMPIASRVAQFDLTLLMTEAAGELAGSFQFSTDLFDEAAIDRLCEHFRTLLLNIVASPHKPIGALDLLSPREREQQLYDWNDTTRRYPNTTLPQLFEAQVESTPEATALESEAGQVSYRELNDRANQAARYLRRLGVNNESLVAIMMERSVEMVVGLLGVLKAGGAYVPLDAGYPRERLSFMLVDSRAEVLLTQQRLASKVPDGAAKVVCVDTESEAIGREETANPVSEVSAANLAYVIYTSGSTGRPKGVMISHGGLANYLNWCLPAYEVTKGKGAPLHSPLGFDLSITSLFAPLLAGRSVTLLEPSPEIAPLLSALSSGGCFSLVKITPAHLESLNESIKGMEPAGWTRALIVGGEALYNDSLGGWRSLAPETRIINEYGPTETVVGCCSYEVSGADAASGAVPIGRPIGNTQAYVLNARLELMPVGVTGELYIGGAGVARGYRSLPELTAARFLPHPFSREPGARLYRTGDLARYLADGNLEFIGRADDQVKIRGYRIELGEIEAVLKEHQLVRDACVTAPSRAVGERQLVAYLVTEAAITTTELRTFLQRRLPSYMLPSAFLTVDKLPLTAHGKIDRAALPAPDNNRPELSRAYLAPRTKEEEWLVELWAQLLGVKDPGVEDDFFELGGHSLLAAQVIARIHDKFDVEVPLRAMLESPTVSALAQALKTARAGVIAASPLKLVRVSREARRLSRPDGR